jgi:hypothetical protein
MKHLKIFEEFKAGNLYVMDEDVTQIEVDGFPVKIVNREDVSGLKSIYNIITVSKGVAQLGIKSFSELDDAKNQISRLINIYQNPPNGDEPVEVGSFIIIKTILDLIAPNNKKTASEDGEPINSNKIHNHIEKNINVLVDAYLAISPQRHKATFTKDVIRKGLVRLQQECKFNDLSRTKEAIEVFNSLMKPMMDDVNKSKNIEVWKLGANGKKYYSVFKDFRTMANLI